MTTASIQTLDGPRNPLLSTLKVLRTPAQTYAEWFETYGDPLFARTLNGPIVLTARPDLVREVFAADPTLFDPFAAEALAPILGTQAIFLLKGQEHRDERKLMMPPLHGARMRHYGELITAASRAALAGLEPGERFTMQEVALKVSMDVILRAVFGVQSPEEIERISAHLERVMALAHPALFFSKATQVSLMGMSPWDRFKRATEEADALIFKEIEARRGNLEGRQDIMSLLMSARYEDGGEVSAERLRDQLVTLLIAGHETTSVALSWAMDQLHRNPEILAELRATLAEDPSRTPDEIARLPLLKAICNETLRLYPVIPAMLRTLRKPWSLGGVELPEGTGIGIAAVTTHRNPDLYPEPDAFRPVRFVGKTMRPWEFYPFGGGHRRCIGAAFATYEMSLALATFVTEARFELLETAPVKPVRRNITMGPATGIRMRLVNRLV